MSKYPDDIKRIEMCDNTNDVNYFIGKGWVLIDIVPACKSVEFIVAKLKEGGDI